jgi:hypothetical protein
MRVVKSVLRPGVVYAFALKEVLVPDRRTITEADEDNNAFVRALLD